MCATEGVPASTIEVTLYSPRSYFDRLSTSGPGPSDVGCIVGFGERMDSGSGAGMMEVEG